MVPSLAILSFLVLAITVEAEHAALPADVYWRSAFPSSPMPRAIRSLLRPSAKTAESGHEDGVGDVFFLEKDLHPGSKMTLHFTQNTAGAAFLPRPAADSIPFSSSKLPEILSRLSVDPASSKATAMKNTLAECEAAVATHGICATSLESMAEFATSALGTRDVRAVSTQALGRDDSVPRQQYAVAGVNRLPASELVVCHGKSYAYAVFQCHPTSAAAYAVSLVGADRTRVEALAACHSDEAAGVAEAFKRLHVKPWSVPVCHFLPQDDLLWVHAQ